MQQQVCCLNFGLRNIWYFSEVFFSHIVAHHKGRNFWIEFTILILSIVRFKELVL